MKNKIKVSLIFVGGLLVGALLAFIVLGQISYLEYRDYFMMASREQTFIASELRANRHRELQDRTEANRPQIAVSIHDDRKLRSASGAQTAWRGLRNCYEMSSLPTLL